jgi:lipid-binding SYLF domain-containing protein
MNPFLGLILEGLNMRALLFALFAAYLTVAAPSAGEAASAVEIDAAVDATLHSFEGQIPGARELAIKAAGILVFPSVVKAGIGVGREYGEGLLIIHGRPGGSVIIMFMMRDALASLENTNGWKAGVDGSIAIVTLGTGGSIDTENLTGPVIGSFSILLASYTI